MADRIIPNLERPRIDAAVEQLQALGVAMKAQGLILHNEEPQTDELITTADCTNLATGLVLCNEIRAKYVAHIASTAKHKAADSTNTVTAPAATDQTTLNALATELKADLNAHHDSATFHNAGPGAGKVGGAPADTSVADATDLSSSVALTNALKAMFNAHIASGLRDLVIGPS